MAKILPKGISFATTYLRDNAGQLDIAAATAANFHAPNTDTSLDLGGSNPVTAAAIKAFIDSKAQNSGLASLDSSGKIPTGQLPALSITDTFVVTSQVEMLALTAEVGDVAVRTDLSKSFILRVAGASTLANWQELLSPSDAVTSVNGQTGTVVLDAGDIGFDNVTSGLTATDVQAAIDEIEDRVDELESDVTTLQGDVSSLETRMDTAETDITALEGDVSSLTGRMDTAESDIDAAEARLTTAESDIDALETDVGTLQTDVTALDGRLDTAESDIDDLQARTNIVRQFVTLNSGMVAAKQVTLTSNPTSVAVISVTIRGIGTQFPTDDFALVDGNKVDWNNSEGMDSLGLVSGDKLLVEYAI